MMKIAVSLFLLLQFVSCGKDSSLFQADTVTSYNVEPATEEDFVYEFTTLKCTTGEQSSNTFEGICENLSNSELNNDCAESKRLDLFESANCEGEFISSES